MGNVQLKVGPQFGEVRGRVVLERDSVCSELKMIWEDCGVVGEELHISIPLYNQPE